jgi:hypothetical protein
MTISFNYLGNLGHLGNQMFQYAALIGLSKKYNRPFCIPHEKTFGGAFYTELRSSIYEAFPIAPIKGLSRFPTVDEGQFHFNQNLFNNFPTQDINLHGFFQSDKWFSHAEDEVRDAFTFKPEYMEVAQEMRSQLSGDIVAIHVRRTDYLTNPNHEALGLDYYARALGEVPNDCTVIIFTDDPEWAKEQELFPDDRFFVSETNCPYTDMALMSLCDYHIIGNSTFSWWGAWLSESKQVIAPKDWFGAPLGGNNLTDLYCDGWKVL